MERLKRLFQNKYLNYAIYAPFVICGLSIVIILYLLFSVFVCRALASLLAVFFGSYDKIPHILAWSLVIFSLFLSLSVVLLIVKCCIFASTEVEKGKERQIESDVEH